MREKILTYIEKNSRVSLKDLAILLGTDEVTVANEIAQMEKEHIICGYHTLIDWDKTTEEKVTALIEVKVTPQRGQGFDKIAERLYNYPEVDCVYLVSGGYDFMVMIEGKTMRSVAQFVSDKLSPRFDTAEKIDSELIEFYVVAQDYSWTYIKTHEGDGCGHYFSSFELAYQSIVEHKQVYLDDSDLENIETYATIKRIYLDRTDDQIDIFYFDNALRMAMMSPTRKWFKAENEQDKIDLIEDCYMYVPIPFRTGDLVKIQSPFCKTDYGVVPFNQRSREDDICLNHGGDGSDMVTTLDSYLDWRDEFDFMDGAELLSLRRCTVEELPEKQKVLEKVALARKGEWDWFSLLMKEY